MKLSPYSGKLRVNKNLRLEVAQRSASSFSCLKIDLLIDCKISLNWPISASFGAGKELTVCCRAASDVFVRKDKSLRTNRPKNKPSTDQSTQSKAVKQQRQLEMVIFVVIKKRKSEFESPRFGIFGLVGLFLAKLIIFNPSRLKHGLF